AVGERQLRQSTSRRAGDVKIVSHAVSHTQVAKADAVRPHADQFQLKSLRLHSFNWANSSNGAISSLARPYLNFTYSLTARAREKERKYLSHLLRRFRAL